MNLLSKSLKKMGPIGAYADYAHGYYTFPRLEGEIGNKMIFMGKEKIIWSLNNYLGLANCPVIRQADAEGAGLYGLAYPMGARMMTGNTVLHEKLESGLANFVSKEDAFLLNYGYQGMLSIIDSLVDRHDVIVYDAESHACIIDGMRLHIGKRFVYKHNDMEDLEKQLQRARKITAINDGGILVITEGVFGMRGDMGKIQEIVSLKEKFDFTLLVDDAHGIGVMGKTGAGTGEDQNAQSGIDLYFATFAKSFAGIGAFVAGKHDIIKYLKYNMRSQIYAKSLPMPMVYGLLKRLELLKTDPDLRERLWEITAALQSGLIGAGFQIGNTQSPVTPVYLDGTPDEAAALVWDLREHYDIFCSIVVYPVIPKGTMILRLIPTASHTLQDVAITIQAFKDVKEKLKDGYYTKQQLTRLEH
ncbi:MAG: aminotransferase class I/II-fold pyridoxal phosphate-dependent enzyme [Taibaiella sp.]|jgi:glycine C-acetyltransferase